jgi:hypothetical protein
MLFHQACAIKGDHGIEIKGHRDSGEMLMISVEDREHVGAKVPNGNGFSMWSVVD